MEGRMDAPGHGSAGSSRHRVWSEEEEQVIVKRRRVEEEDVVARTGAGEGRADQPTASSEESGRTISEVHGGGSVTAGCIVSSADSCRSISDEVAPAATPVSSADGSTNCSLEQRGDESMAIVVYRPPCPAPLHVVDPVQVVDLGAVAPPPAGDSARGFSCKECGKWYATHQALGGHVAGHRNRLAAAAAAGLGEAGGAARPAKAHVCLKCGEVYDTGVALGGHMRKHYGKKIKLKRRNAGDPAPSAPLQQAPQAMEERNHVNLELSLAPAAAPLPPAVAAPLPAEVAVSPPPVAVSVQALAACSVRILGVTILLPPTEEEDDKKN